jgi:hypothetical protein
MTARERSTWWWFLAVCVGVRVAIPLAALAAEGTKLPGLPRYDYGPFYGDANGYYATARELVSAAGRGAIPLFAVLVAGAVAAWLVRRRFGGRSWVMAVVVGGVVSAATIVLVLTMRPAGEPAIGWPLLWAIPLAPLRIVGLDPDIAFAFGLFISLAAVGCTVVATAFAGYWSTGRRSIGFVAAALFTVWPFVPGLVVGSQGWENGTWNVDTGLHLYAEPLSTALVVGAVALLLRERATDLTVALAGLALGFSTVVKLTNGIIVAGLVVVVACARDWKRAALLAGSSLVFAPVLITYWAKGYAATYDGAISSSNHVWSLSHIRETWGDSLLFTPALLLLLVPLAVLGAAVLPARKPRALLLVPIVLTVIVYSVYQYTALHPRFFYVVLPQMLVLDAAGAVWIVCRARSRGGANRSRSVND